MSQASGENGSETTVLVIGGGPVGLTASCELARYGIAFRCVDKRAEPVHHSHASVVHTRTQEVFHAMGCSAGFVREGFLYAEQVFYAFGKRLGQMHLNGVDSPFDGPRDIWQSTTERLLIEHQASLGKAVERPVEAIAYREEGAVAVVTLKHADGRTEEVRADWVISAEGSHSLVRDTLQIPFEGPRYENQEFVQTDAKVKWHFPNGVGHAFIERDRFIGFFPFDGNGFYRVLCARAYDGPVRHEPPTLAELEQIVKESVDPDAVLSEPAWLNRFHAQRKKAAMFHKGRAFLAGDSGHVHVPVGGQGMNTGIQDAFNLAWKLAYVIKGWAKPELLDTYNAERHPVAENLLKFTDSGFQTLAKPGGMQALLINTFGGLLLQSDLVQDKIRTTLEEIGINYRGGPLADGTHRGELHSGDRALTSRVVRSEDLARVSLLDILRGPHWTLLGFAGHEPADAIVSTMKTVAATFGSQLAVRLALTERPTGGWPKEVPYLIDRGGELHKKYAIHSPAFVLIRPDWYVATIQSVDRSTAIIDYLNRWLLPAA
jgi:3-(3-hydroxy-phenyl)propionate hydroxylase